MIQVPFLTYSWAATLDLGCNPRFAKKWTAAALAIIRSGWIGPRMRTAEENEEETTKH